MSMIGKWSSWYSQLGEDALPSSYGDSISYEMGTSWLKDCSLVEDWGCGLGWLRTLIPTERYRGLDGTDSPFADRVVDLTDYRSEVPGLFMRHVLEHNLEWEKVLDNALASFTERMALILFTPMAKYRTHSIPGFENHGEIEVPAISFLHEDLVRHFDLVPGIDWSREDIHSQTMFGRERIYYLEKV